MAKYNDAKEKNGHKEFATNAMIKRTLIRI
jgi:hypothetical protein